ncbi:MAG: response regulator receiver protein [Polaromonas sp.]|nr:response regulator receiver protein [Polaromonas sp.]
MNHLTRNDYAAALQLLVRIEARTDSVQGFGQALVEALSGFVASELTTLSVCDLRTGRRQLAGLPGALSPDARRRAGLGHAIAVPLFSDRRTQVSVVLNRCGLDFDERDRERLELLRPHLAFLYRHACRRRKAAESGARARPPPDLHPPGLTRRETQVMHWLAGGKRDAEIAALLAISRRTVQKHLEHIYVKLGVETRTAAVMRALASCERSAALNPAGIL